MMRFLGPWLGFGVLCGVLLATTIYMRDVGRAKAAVDVCKGDKPINLGPAGWWCEYVAPSGVAVMWRPAPAKEQGK